MLQSRNVYNVYTILSINYSFFCSVMFIYPMRYIWRRQLPREYHCFFFQEDKWKTPPSLTTQATCHPLMHVLLPCRPSCRGVSLTVNPGGIGGCLVGGASAPPGFGGASAPRRWWSHISLGWQYAGAANSPGSGWQMFTDRNQHMILSHSL